MTDRPDARPISGQAADTAWVVFAWSWALSVELGMVSRAMATTPMRMVVTLCALLVLLFPKRPALLFVLSAAWCVHITVDSYNHVFVHHWLVTLGSWVILLAVGVGFRRDPAAWRERALRGLRVAAPAVATIGLFAAGFSKLNTGFLDPATSCAGTLYQWQREYFPWALLPSGSWTVVAAIGFTLTSELLGPVLVWTPRTRRLGMMLMMGFFLAIGTNAQARLYEFSGPFIALFSPLLDWGPLVARLDSVRARLPRWAPAAGILLIVGLAVAGDAPGTMRDIKMVGARVVYVAAVAAVVAAVLWGKEFPRLPRAPQWAWLVPLIGLAHESLAYVGLRTHRNFAMAANFMVNTEISDHVIVRRVPDLGINRLAVLDRSSDEELNRRGRGGLPMWVLADEIARHPKLTVTYTYEGVETVVTEDTDHKQYTRSAIAEHLVFMVQSLGPRPPGCGHTAPSARGR